MNDNSVKIIDLDINDILPNRFQPRIQFDEEEILDLSDSIKEHGVIQPIVVRPIGDKYEIIAGERRYKASVLAGKESVPVIVKDLNDKDSAEIALIENIQRKNLTPIEEALSYKKILDMGYITQESLGTKLGKSQSSIANKIRLLNLSDEVQEALLESKISERHARSLLKLKTEKEQNLFLNRIITERMTVRKTDEEIQKYLEEAPEGEEKIKSKEVKNMDYNLENNVMPAQQPQAQGFDIFGTSNNSVEQSQQSTFDIFGTGNNAQPQAVQPSVDQAPINPVTAEFSNIGVQPQAFDMPTVQPVQPQFEAQQEPVINSTPETVPTIDTTNIFTQPIAESTDKGEGGTQILPTFDIPQAPAVETQQAPAPVEMPNIVMPSIEMPTPVQEPINQPQIEVPSVAIPSVEQPVFNLPEIESEPAVQPQSIPSQVPETSPIIDSTNVFTQPVAPQGENMNEGNDETQVLPTHEPVEPTLEPEPVIQPANQEPIIITDFTKQYDPVMPQQQVEVKPTIDFKEVINAIRECSAKIEQYGYKIDVEEYDLANLYQVVFKIDK